MMRHKENHKFQITNYKQIPMTEIQNSKRDIVGHSLLWLLGLKILNLFDIWCL